MRLLQKSSPIVTSYFFVPAREASTALRLRERVPLRERGHVAVHPRVVEVSK